jgi:hypothetical protein
VDAGSLVIRVVLDLLLLAVFVAVFAPGFLALYEGHGYRELIVSALWRQPGSAGHLSRASCCSAHPAQRLRRSAAPWRRAFFSGPGTLACSGFGDISLFHQKY